MSKINVKSLIKLTYYYLSDLIDTKYTFRNYCLRQMCRGYSPLLTKACDPHSTSPSMESGHTQRGRLHNKAREEEKKGAVGALGDTMSPIRTPISQQSGHSTRPYCV